MVKIDMTNQRIGNLVVIKEVKSNTKKVKWLCQCDCGELCTVSSDRLRSHKKTHCGCKGYDKTGSLIGKRVGKLTVDSYVGVCNQKRMWKCKCDCGNEITLSSAEINIKKTRSCGCLRHESGEKRTKYRGNDRILYFRLSNMKGRCYNKNDPAYANYGGRGIKICDEWLNDFWSFRNWALENGFEPELSIDRIDNDGDYTPSNCRWTDKTQQANNRRTNRCFTINGETKTLAEWCRKYNMTYSVVQSRIEDGWDIEKALKEPSRAKSAT